MKNETKVKKLVLKKETLRDLTAQNAGGVKGGARTHGKKCATGGCPTGGQTCAGYTCPTGVICSGFTCYTCGWGCMTYYPCH